MATNSELFLKEIYRDFMFSLMINGYSYIYIILKKCGNPKLKIAVLYLVKYILPS